MSDLWVLTLFRPWRRRRGLARWLSRTWRALSRWLLWRGARSRRGVTRDYERFMRGSAWAAQRARVFHRDHRICQDCRTVRATEAHHNYYSRPIEATPDSAITSLCSPCHARRHRTKAPRRQW